MYLINTSHTLFTKTITQSLLIIMLAACGGGSSEKEVAIPKPANVSVSSDNGESTISWDSLSSLNYDLYLATEDGLNFQSYANSENSQWIKNVSSPYIFKPNDYSKVYFFALVAKSGSQESIQSNILSTKPRYDINGPNITDLKTSLTWARCSIGQTWSESNQNCEGVATRLSHQESLAFISTLDGNWRLPTAIELLSLVYCDNSLPDFFLNTEDPDYLTIKVHQGCDSDNLTTPTIDNNVFQNTKIEPTLIYTPLYRTSTQKYYSSSPGYTFYHSVNFKEGGVFRGGGGEPTALMVRLINGSD